MSLWSFRLAPGLAAVAFSVTSYAQNAAPANKDSNDVRANLLLTSGATQYQQGELIEISIRFTTGQPENFELNAAQKSSRWNTESIEEFRVTPADKTVDPLAAYVAPFLSNLRRFSNSPQFAVTEPLPATLTFPLTDWVRFTAPGHYKLSVRTYRISARTGAPGLPGPRIALDTNQIAFEILPADPAWQARRLTELSSRQPIDWPAIRALGTADAARFIARHYGSDQSNSLDSNVLLGLFGSPHQKQGAEEMQRLLRDPDFPVTPSFLEALAFLELPPEEATWASARERLPAICRQLYQALPAKRGPALATSEETYIAGLEQSAGVKLSSEVITQLQRIFEQLPPGDQDLWLDQRWTQVAGPGWLPVLQRLALRDILSLGGGNADLDPLRTMSALALKRWYELDPATAREAILREIVSPTPRFGANTLGLLPDRTLPEQEHIIARNFASLADPNTATHTRATLRDLPKVRAAYEMANAHLGSLLFRYGDRDVLPEVLAVLKKRLADRDCFAQANALAFLIKVDPEQADLLLRGVCAPATYSQLGRLIASPVIERLAIASLNDADYVTATEALRYLRDQGSAKAEQPIFERLVQWSAKWRDRASEVNSPRVQPNWEISFGRELAQTLMIGHGWFADEARILQVQSLSLQPLSGGEFEVYLRYVREKPIRINFMGSVGPMFLVGPYELNSVEDLERKLMQYPPGVVFAWSDHRSPTYDVMDHKLRDEMASWSRSKGVHIEGL